MALSTTSNNSGSQGSTYNALQTSVVPSGLAGQQASGVQPGTANSLLTTQVGGVPLGNASLSTISLAPSGNTTTSSAAVAATHTVPHKINNFYLGGIGLLFVLAIILFLVINRKAKNTTNY